MEEEQLQEKQEENGILPLDDASAMALLGREIGQNVIINATLINKMNGRTLSKELQRIEQKNDFAYNM